MRSSRSDDAWLSLSTSPIVSTSILGDFLDAGWISSGAEVIFSFLLISGDGRTFSEKFFLETDGFFLGDGTGDDCFRSSVLVVEAG